MPNAPKLKINGTVRTIKYENASFGYVVLEVVCKCDSCLLSNSQGQLVSDRVHRKHFKAQQIRYRQKNKKYSPPIKGTATRRFIPLKGQDLEEFLASGQAELTKLVSDYVYVPEDLSDEHTEASETSSSYGEDEDDSDGGEAEDVEEVNVVRNHNGAGFHREPLSLDFWKEGIPMNSSFSLGSYLADRIGDWLRFSPSREQINSELDQMHHRFGMITSSEFNSCIRKIQPESRVHVTCSEHHSIQPISDRGKKCEYDSGRGICNRKLKITIRSNSMINIFSRKMKDPEYAKNIGWGPAFKEKDATITSFWGGQFVQDMRKEFPDFFEGEHTPVIFGTFIDGFNPNYYENGTLCSGTIICFNLPPHIRMKEDNLQLNLVIDGPKEPRNFQTYFEQIVDDFSELWETFEVYNAHTNQTERYRAALIVCIQDGRGMSKTSMMSEAGHKYGCSKCTVIGSYSNGKFFYTSRGNLPFDHPMRGDPAFGPKLDDFWVHKDHDFVISRAEEIDNPQADQDWIAGIKGKSVLTRLPYWDVGKGHLTCFMHTVFNIGKRIEALTLGKYDTVEAREQLKKDGLKCHLHLPEEDVKSYHDWRRTERRMKKRARTQAKAVPTTPVQTADQEENIPPNANQGDHYIPKGSLPALTIPDWRFGYRQIDGCGMLNEKSAMEFLRFIKPPASFCVSLSSFFKDSKERDNEIGKGKGKAEGYRQFMISGVMSAALLVGGVDKGVVQAYDDLFHCIKKMGNPVVIKEEFETLELETIEAVCRIEKEIPRSEAVLSLHQIIHLPRQCLWFGPVRETWAYPLESFLGSLKRMTKNRAHSGASIFSRHMFNTAISIIRGLIKRLCKDSHDVERRNHSSYLRCEGNGAFYSLDIDEILSIKSYIEREWCTFKHMRREYADPWIAGEEMSAAEKSQFKGRKKKILDGLSPIASSYKKFSIFRTIFGAREGERDNSVVIVGKCGKIDYIARILKIIEVKMGEDSEVFVKVALFHGMEYHNILRNRPIAIKKRDIGMTESWIQDKDIIDQGFLAPDPTLCTDPDTERFFVFDLGYLRSSDYKFTLNSYINEQCEIEAASA